MPTIREIRSLALNIELTEPFGISTGAQTRADNVLVQIQLQDGNIGLGEAAPFPAVSGETQASALEALLRASPDLVGKEVARWRPLCREVHERMPHCPSAACALQSALLDAWLKSLGCSMWSFFGGAEASLRSDITLPTGSVDAAISATKKARALGFSTLKVKVGGDSVEHDLRRLQAIAREAPEVSLVLDANGAFSADQALELLDALGPHKRQIDLFEQPTGIDDWEGLGRVRHQGGVQVAADESARSCEDVIGLIAHDAVNAINVKLTKSGIPEALDMIALAKTHGLGLMIGGMVESELAMSVSACVAAGVGGFRWVDLDTPLFMRSSPFSGGFQRSGAELRVDLIEAGHGVRVPTSLC